MIARSPRAASGQFHYFAFVRLHWGSLPICRQQKSHRMPGRTPFIFVEVATLLGSLLKYDRE